MVLEHYKLAIQPFGVTPDPRFLYLSPTHREAMASLLYAIQSGRGFSALIAAPGMGKTTLLFNLLRILDGNAKTAFLFQTFCGPAEFLSALLADLGIEDDGKTIAGMQAKLNEHLLRESQNGRHVVVVIDEAQNLSDQVLEAVRMLSNFETPNKKLMHVVLSGQPQLAEKLASGQLTQLRQRISIVARLAPMNAKETCAYIEHRLQAAGHTSGEPLFTKEACAMIATHSGGTPRDINNLCFNSMSLACALRRPGVDGSMVREVIGDLDLKALFVPPENGLTRRDQPALFVGSLLGPAPWRPGVAAAIVLLACMASLFFYMSRPLIERLRLSGLKAAEENLRTYSSGVAAEQALNKPISLPPQKPLGSRSGSANLASIRRSRHRIPEHSRNGSQQSQVPSEPKLDIVPFASAAQGGTP